MPERFPTESENLKKEKVFEKESVSAPAEEAGESQEEIKETEEKVERENEAVLAETRKELEKKVFEEKVAEYEAKKQESLNYIYENRKTIVWEEIRQMYNKLIEINPYSGSSGQEELLNSMKNIEEWKKRQEEVEAGKKERQVEEKIDNISEEATISESKPEAVPEKPKEIEKYSVEWYRQKVEKEKERSRQGALKQMEKEREYAKKQAEDRRRRREAEKNR